MIKCIVYFQLLKKDKDCVIGNVHGINENASMTLAHMLAFQLLGLKTCICNLCITAICQMWIFKCYDASFVSQSKQFAMF